MRLIDLREHREPELLRAFVRLYDRTFTEPSEREDPSQWAERLWGGPRLGEPVAHLVLATDAAGGEVLGGLLFEYYPESRCGLLAYLVVEPAQRRRGLARRLIDCAIDILEGDAATAGVTLRAVFAETEDPVQAPEDSAMPPQQRLAAFDRLGAKWVDLPYVQPALGGGGGRARHLLLLAFGDGDRLPPLAPDVVRDFLREYYRSLGVNDPARDPDWSRMAESIEARVVLRALTER